MKKEMICFRCSNVIKIDTEYFAFSEFNRTKLIRTDYAHKICWNLFLKQVSDTTETMGVIRGLKEFFIQRGILRPEEVVIR